MFQYILFALDQWTSFLFTRALKTKLEQEVSQAFDSIIAANDGVSPYFVNSVSTVIGGGT